MAGHTESDERLQDLASNPAALLSRLIRFDTTNPPGRERECVGFIASLLTASGVEARVLACDEERPNVVARIPGRNAASPLLLYGHVDVVGTRDQQWRHPPFGGVVEGAAVWGRGALDMKGGVAMMLSAFIRLSRSEVAPADDIILAVVSDEEVGEGYGAAWLVERYPELFRGVRYAIGEFGGFSVEFGGRRLYPIQISERQKCWLEARVHGAGGHASLRLRGGAMARAAQVISDLDRERLPVHVTPQARLMIESMAGALPTRMAVPLRALLIPRLTDRILDLLGERAALFDPVLHNTVTATVIRGGEQVNVMPSEVKLQLDGRLLPGQSVQDFLSEVGTLVGPDVELAVTHHDPGPATVDMGLYDTLAAILKDQDPEARPVPLLLAGTTDARFFASLGIQTYGFTPMQLPPDFEFMRLIHGANERIPVGAVEFGTAAIERLLASSGWADS